AGRSIRNSSIALEPQSNPEDGADLEAAIDQAIAACGDDTRAAKRLVREEKNGVRPRSIIGKIYSNAAAFPAEVESSAFVSRQLPSFSFLPIFALLDLLPSSVAFDVEAK